MNPKAVLSALQLVAPWIVRKLKKHPSGDSPEEMIAMVIQRVLGLDELQIHDSQKRDTAAAALSGLSPSERNLLVEMAVQAVKHGPGEEADRGVPGRDQMIVLDIGPVLDNLIREALVALGWSVPGPIRYSGPESETTERGASEGSPDS